MEIGDKYVSQAESTATSGTVTTVDGKKIPDTRIVLSNDAYAVSEFINALTKFLIDLDNRKRI